MAPTNMTVRQAQVIDPILTTQARGYVNAEAIFPALFPVVDIPVRSMRAIRFGRQDFRLMNTRRAPGTATRTVTYGYESDPVALVQDALNASVPREIMEAAAAVPNVDMASRAVNLTQNVIDLGHEKLSAQLATTPGNFAAGNTAALTGSDKWSDPSSDPFAVVEAGKMTVAAKIGREPNVLALGRNVFGALRKNQKIKDQFKYTGRESVTAEMLAAYFDVPKVVVGRQVYLAEDAADDAAAQFVWQDAAVLAYVNTDGTFLSPSFGYSYRLSGYPLVEEPYFDRATKSWLYGVTQERAPVVTGSDAGFLIQNPV